MHPGKLQSMHTNAYTSTLLLRCYCGVTAMFVDLFVYSGRSTEAQERRLEMGRSSAGMLSLHMFRFKSSVNEWLVTVMLF